MSTEMTLSDTGSAPSIEQAFKHINMGMPADALAILDQCDPSPRKLLGLGHAHKALGNHREAEQAYRDLTEHESAAQAAVGWWSLANLKAAQFTIADATALDRQLASSPAQLSKALLHLARAEIWHQAGIYDQSFEHLSAGNSLLSTASPFQPSSFHRLIQDLLTTTVESSGEAPDCQPAPLFIVGQPRSGTTLIDQILTSHSCVHATDELVFMGHRGADLERQGGYAKALNGETAVDWPTMRNQYLEITARYGKASEGFFTDKTPENFLHIGLIKRLFPKAKIVHVVRDPLDNIIAQFRQYFPEGREYANDIQDLIFYWQGYITVMRHWHQLYADDIAHVCYETLAQQPESEIRKLLDFCGLEFEAACLTPDKNPRVVMTPSAAQVREPINQRSLGSGLAYADLLKEQLGAIGQLKGTVDKLFFGRD